MITTRKLLAPLVAILMTVLLVACESKITISNYDKVQNGWTLSQVQNLLGSGEDQTASGTSISSAGIADAKASSEKTYVWKEGGLVITIIFKDGKVVQKSKTGG